MVVRVSHIFKTMLFRSFTRACPNEFPCDKSIKRWSMEIFLWALVIKGVFFLKRWDAPSVKTFLTTYTTWLFNNQISTASRPSSRPPWFVCSVHKYCIKWNTIVYDIKYIERFSIKCQYLPETGMKTPEFSCYEHNTMCDFLINTFEEQDPAWSKRGPARPSQSWQSGFEENCRPFVAFSFVMPYH